jgi:polysaccharide export outer membrane protein
VPDTEICFLREAPELSLREEVMKKSTRKFALLTALAAVIMLSGIRASVNGQSTAQTPPPAEQGERKPAERLSPDEPSAGATLKEAKVLSDADRQAGRREMQSEVDAALQPYYNNYFDNFRFGPEDVISVLVFNQEKYSMANITIPPHGRLNYPLIGEIMMVGRTSTEVEKEIAEKLSEYIIEPKVTVRLDQAHSVKIMVLGDVNAPGVYEMTRRMRLSEALAKANYLSRYAKKTDIRILRAMPDGTQERIPINFKKVEKGEGIDPYLTAGDVVFVPGSFMKNLNEVLQMASGIGWIRASIGR